jgi:hypothetical protein
LPRAAILEVDAMVEVITYGRANGRYACGDSYTNLTVVNFRGPGGVKASAYCCNMNIDMDGEPHAYGPPFDPKITPTENLRNGGWLDTGQNAAKKPLYEAALKTLEGLEKKKADLLKPPAPAGGAPAAPPPAPPDPKVIKALDEQIAALKKEMKKKYFWDEDPAKRPVNFNRIFWSWYGPKAMTPADARGLSFTEMVGDKKVIRRPQLDDKKPYLEDVYGKYPVVQSIYEPGTNYYVSVFPQRINTAFPEWDQRAFLAPAATEQVPYGALSTVLAGATGLDLNDIVLGVRLDTGQSLAFPFYDRGFEPKVAECSLEAFVAFGGEVNHDNVNRSRNDWLVLYLAFAHSAGQSADTLLMKFASAANADDFPMMLAFLAQATVDAKSSRRSAVSGDPLKDYERWKKSQGTNAPGIAPSTFAVVNQTLTSAGFSPFAQRVLKKHPSLMGQGPFLTPPTRP